MESFQQHLETLQSFDNRDNAGMLVVPPQKLEEMRKRFVMSNSSFNLLHSAKYNCVLITFSSVIADWWWASLLLLLTHILYAFPTTWYPPDVMYSLDWGIYSIPGSDFPCRRVVWSYSPHDQFKPSLWFLWKHCLD